MRLASSLDGENMYYQHGDAKLTFPASFTIEARMRLVSGTSSTSSRGPANIVFVYGAAHMKNAVHIADGEVFLLEGENVKGDSFTLDTTTDFHTYKLVVDTASADVELFVDDVLELSGTAFVDPNASPEYISFGDGSLFGNGTSEWEFVRHNAYDCE